MSHFESVEEIRNNDFNMRPEYFNSFVCEGLQRHYEMMKNKLPFEPMVDDGKDYFYNQRGAKIYKDIERQPMLPIHEGDNIYNVLSVGFSNNGCPLVTISEDGRACCYRLPSDYGEWAMTVVGFANHGEKFFPAEVVFSLIDGKHYADIL